MASLRPLTTALCWALMIWACLARESRERSNPSFLAADQLSPALLNHQNVRVGIALSEEAGYPALGNTHERDLESLKSSKNLEMDRKLGESSSSGTDVSKQLGDSRTKTQVPKELEPKDPTKKTKSSDQTRKVDVSSDLPGKISGKPGAEKDEQKNESKQKNTPSESTGDQTNPPPENHSKDTETVSDGPSNKVEMGGQNLDTNQLKDCDGDHGCEAGKVFACLGISDAGTQELSLLVQNKGDKTVNVTVHFPALLRVEPANLTLEKGKKQLAHIALVDYRAAMPSNATNITISIGDGDCLIEVPFKNLLNATQWSFFQGLPYLPMITPMVLVSVLFIFIVVAGIWLCCRYRRKRRHADDFKYQELEMGLPGVDASKYQQKKASKGDEEDTDGWDEVWDDGWEEADTARSSSLLRENLSSKGLATRRSNKDGWDNSWDD